MNREQIIVQVARDYDMEYHEVERIYDMYHDKDPLEFYVKLEEFINTRAKN